MSAMSDYLERELANHLFRSSTFSAPGTIAVALLQSSAADEDSGSTLISELPAGATYQRVVVNQWLAGPAGTSLGSHIKNAADINFADPTGEAGNIVRAGALTDNEDTFAGNLLFHGSLASPIVLDGVTQFKFAGGSLVVSIA